MHAQLLLISMDVPRDAPGDDLYAEIRDQDTPTQEVAPPHAVTGHTPPEYEDVAPKLSSDYKVTKCAAHAQ